jgi:ubiquinone/menaquinone biosynthesis C-methylase UbiE
MMSWLRDLHFALRHSEQWRIYSDFLNDQYQQHNLARLQHLAGLKLNIDGKRVLEVGAGIGDHTLFYLYRNCEILPTDGRAINVDFMRKRLGIRAEVLDPELHPEAMVALGKFDILHCYGFLYHIQNPEVFLAHAARIAQTIFLETCVSFGSDAQKNVVDEQSEVLSQALHGKGCRPTRRWVFETLQQHYKYVYCPTTQPRHAEFPTHWDKPFPNPGQLTRAVFVASHSPIENDQLLTEVPRVYR